MALSGSVETTAYGKRKLKLSWTATQSIANNTSTISWTLSAASTQSGGDDNWYRAGAFKVTINGTKVYSTTQKEADRITLEDNTKIKSGTTTITHNSDGTKSFTISVEGAIYYYAPNVSGSKSFTLDTIPRGATLTAAPDFNDEGNPAITYSNPAGNAVSALDVCISFDGSNDDINYRSVSKTGTSYTFSLTDAERKVLRKGTTSNSRTVRFYIRTKIGDNTFYNSLTKTLTLVNHTPTLSPTAQVSTSSTTYSLTGSQTIFIKGYTDVSVSTGAAARKEASLTSQKITCGNSVINSGSGTFTSPTSGTFTFSATDSRGNTTTQTLTRTLVNYLKPTCNISVKMTTDGVATINISGNIFNGSFGAVQNTLAVQYRYKELGGSWSSWTGAGTGTKNGNTYTASPQKTGLDYRKTYVFQARAYDKLYTVNSAEESMTALPVFDWGPDSFNFNVPVNFSAGYTQTVSAIDDTPVASDFIVEQGTSGDWTYRKWNSGIAECWARIAVNTAVSTAWGGLYVSGALSATNLTFPFTFTAIPMINVNLSGSGSGAFLIASGSASSSTTKTGIYEIARGNTAAAANYGINYDIKGRWK